jgi:hypothetical protein
MRKIILILLGCAGALTAAGIQDYQFISPKPGSDYNTRESTIIIRQGSKIDPGSLLDPDLILVVGSVSGPVSGHIILSSDEKTVIFKPDFLFAPDEQVTVTVKKGMSSRRGDPLPQGSYSFKVAPFVETPNPYALIEDLKPGRVKKDIVAGDFMLQEPPVNFPAITTHIYDEAALGNGYIFLAVAADKTTTGGVGYYLMILDNDGTPVKYKELTDDYAYDFKVQPNGLMTYAQFIEHHSYTGGGDVIHMVMDTSFTDVDSFQMQNGYVAEGHDFQLLPNGHSLMFGYYLTQVDMSQYVDGGVPDALVSGGIIQEQDAERNVIFQWRSWDYYDFAEYSWGRRSTQAIVSAFHLNTINLDNDGHIFLATPEWVKKINRQTGEMIWHLGGDENEFSFFGEDSADGSSHFGGHAFHRIPNGNVLIYDNGNRQGTRSSQAWEYTLNEKNREATFVWNFTPDTIIAAWHRGNAQRLPNGNTFIGWGGASGDYIPTCTEVNSNGDVLLEVSFDNPLVESYRAFRFPFPGDVRPIEDSEEELGEGNHYDFIQGDTLDTGVSIDINSISGSGYNIVWVKRWPFAPLYPVFPGKAPRVLPVRVYITNPGNSITSINATVSFDAAEFGFSYPDTLVIYQREFPGSGLFIPLETPDYNPVTEELSVNINRFGEFIFAIPDLEEVAYTPVLRQPALGDTLVNRELPVSFFWSPRGIVSSSHIQVSTDSQFTTLVVNDSGLTETRYTMPLVQDTTVYYWRVRIKNLAGTSAWDNSWFRTSAPMIELGTPDGGEAWQLGLTHYVRWHDNITEDVVVELHKGDAFFQILDTTKSSGAYEWDISYNLPTADDYRIKIKSLVVDTLYDLSTLSFSIIDTILSIGGDKEIVHERFHLYQNYPNPFNPKTIITYELPVANYVDLSLYNILGEKVANLVSEKVEAGQHQAEWDATGFASGVYYYKLNAGEFQQVRKMVLIK